MDENLFKRRTKQLALRVIKTVESLPKNRTALKKRQMNQLTGWNYYNS